MYLNHIEYFPILITFYLVSQVHYTAKKNPLIIIIMISYYYYFLGWGILLFREMFQACFVMQVPLNKVHLPVRMNVKCI